MIELLNLKELNLKTIEAHNNFILNLLERTLTKDDTLYHLGDFGYDVHSKKGSNELDKTVRERWKKLPCKKNSYKR